MATLTGILIATTDRVGFIDQGIVSRTDLAVGFTLTERTRRQIWTDGIAESAGRSWIMIDDRAISSIAKYPLDGHTITNIIRSAFRIARSEYRTISIEDIEKYVQESNELSKYLLELHDGDNRGVLAKAREWRRGSPDDAEGRESEDQESEDQESDSSK